MKKFLIILAGYTATGKTYIANSIRKDLKDFEIISIDEIEEMLYDKHGFNNKDEKKALYDKSFQLFYKRLDEFMRLEKNIIIDYPFSDLQKSKLEKLINNYSYNALTIRLIGDLKQLYKRRLERDLREDRHPGHLLPFYNNEIKVDKSLREKYVITEEDFINHAKLRKYDEFRLGKLLEIDVTEKYADVNNILDWIRSEYE